MFGHLVRFCFHYKISLKDDGMYVLNYNQWNTSIPWYASRYWEKSFLNLNIGNANLEAKKKRKKGRGIGDKMHVLKDFLSSSIGASLLSPHWGCVRTVSGHYLKQDCRECGRLYCSPSSKEVISGNSRGSLPFLGMALVAYSGMSDSRVHIWDVYHLLAFTVLGGIIAVDRGGQAQLHPLTNLFVSESGAQGELQVS